MTTLKYRCRIDNKNFDTPFDAMLHLDEHTVTEWRAHGVDINSDSTGFSTLFDTWEAEHDDLQSG